MKRARAGSIELVALIDNIQPYPATSVYPQAGDALGGYSGFLDAEGRVELNFASFLFEDAGTTVLVDTGWGPGMGGKLMDELHEAGVAPGAIDIVIFTHLHGDHTGWNLDEAGKPRFPNARYLVPGADWAHYSRQAQAESTASPERSPVSGSFTRDVEPLLDLGVLELFDGEKTLTPAATAIPTPGHTPGHTSIAIASGSDRAFILGDVVISAIDAIETDWQNGFDWDHETARATRLRIVTRLIEDGSLVGASHLSVPGLGHFVRADGRPAWRPLAD